MIEVTRSVLIEEAKKMGVLASSKSAEYNLVWGFKKVLGKPSLFKKYSLYLLSTQELRVKISEAKDYVTRRNQKNLKKRKQKAKEQAASTHIKEHKKRMKEGKDLTWQTGYNIELSSISRKVLKSAAKKKNKTIPSIIQEIVEEHVEKVLTEAIDLVVI